MIFGHKKGWAYEKEDYLFLERTSSPFAYRTFSDGPEEFDPRSYIRVENQGSMGSCQGHAISTCSEICYWLATKGRSIQFSRLFAYLQTQLEDGLLGSDRGSTISGGVKVANEIGFPEEKHMPYPNPVSYPSWAKSRNTQPLKELYEESHPFRISRWSKLRTYEEVLSWMKSGQGPVSIGIRWSLPSAGVIESYSGSRGGGHAITLWGWSKRNGQTYIWLLNSWGTSWGNAGWSLVSPRAINQMLATQYTVFMGVSEMPEVRQREWDFIDDSVFW